MINMCNVYLVNVAQKIASLQICEVDAEHCQKKVRKYVSDHLEISLRLV